MKQLSVQVSFVGDDNAVLTKDVPGDLSSVSVAAVLEVMERAVPCLRHLSVLCPYLLDEEVAWFPLTRTLRSLLNAAPAFLITLHTDVECSFTQAHKMMTREAPFGSLSLRRLVLRADWAAESDGEGDDTDDADDEHARFMAFTNDMALCPSLHEVALANARGYNTAVAIPAFVDVALANDVTALHFLGCDLLPSSLASLARLVRRLDHFVLSCGLLFDMINGPVFCDEFCAALRFNTVMVCLTLNHTGLWNHPFAGRAVVDALAGHPSIRYLNLCGNVVASGERIFVGACLARLITANALSFKKLDRSGCELHDDGKRPIFNALSGNLFLRRLCCDENSITFPFAREVVMPSILRNVTLRELKIGSEDEPVLADFLTMFVALGQRTLVNIQTNP